MEKKTGQGHDVGPIAKSRTQGVKRTGLQRTEEFSIQELVHCLRLPC